ncbi:putative acyl-CoA synthetase YngI [Haliotis cracherodii]|uniref:putative acyl-CoA synthetase YngI n=1 Tax=Haliotis cracherodii TaxID=6455 RepID=UPI0039EBAE21
MCDNQLIIHSEATIPTLLKRLSSIDPERPAYIFVGVNRRTVLSRKNVFMQPGKMAAKLRRLGVSRGDTVANMLPNSPDRLICDFGILMAGGVSQTAFGYLNNADDTFGALQVAQTTTIITDPNVSAVLEVVMKLFSSSKETEYGLAVECSELPYLKRVVFIHSVQTQLEMETEMFIADVRPTDYAVIVETSGTSGVCKQVPLTHSAVIRFGEQMCFLIGDNGSPFYNDRFFGWFPGFPSVYPCSGITRIALDARENNLPPILDVIRAEGCRSAYLVPNEIEDVSQSGVTLDEPDMLEVVLTGGQPIVKNSMRIIGSLTKKIVCRYGMSETMCICHLSVDDQGKFQDHCVGHPMPSYHVRVVDDIGRDVRIGVKGSILVKGDGVFEGYLGDSPKLRAIKTKEDVQLSVHNGTEETKIVGKWSDEGRFNRAAFTDDGWFQTDDVGFFDSAGMLFVDGRGSDAIMHGDEILYPHWLEQIARGCPAVHDVVIVPVKDPVLFHEICACIKPTEGFQDPLSEIQTFMSLQFAAVPHEESSVEPKYYLLFDTFPVNKNGKLNRRKLSLQAEVLLQL